MMIVTPSLQSDVAYEYFRDTFTAAVSAPMEEVRWVSWPHIDPQTPDTCQAVPPCAASFVDGCCALWSARL